MRKLNAKLTPLIPASMVKTVGRVPSRLRNRTNYGPNSRRMMGEEALGGAMGAETSVIVSMGNEESRNECECR